MRGIIQAADWDKCETSRSLQQFWSDDLPDVTDEWLSRRMKPGWSTWWKNIILVIDAYCYCTETLATWRRLQSESTDEVCILKVPGNKRRIRMHFWSPLVTTKLTNWNKYRPTASWYWRVNMIWGNCTQWLGWLTPACLSDMLHSDNDTNQAVGQHHVTCRDDDMMTTLRSLFGDTWPRLAAAVTTKQHHSQKIHNRDQSSLSLPPPSSSSSSSMSSCSLINATRQNAIMYRVRQTKVIPCHVLLISQQRIGIFTRKFTRLCLIHIYVKVPNYVKLSPHLTKLCHVRQHHVFQVNSTPALLTVAFFVKTTKTAYQLKSNVVTVASINLADELVILLIFVNNEHFVNTVTVGKVTHADKMRMQTLCEQGFGAI